MTPSNQQPESASQLASEISNNPKPKVAPLVSVVMPFYNTEGYLPECLDSVLNQSFQDFEIIAIDDGSSDRSLDVVLEYAQKDSRIHVLKNKVNSGVSKTANVGMAHARGKYIARLDSDDAYEKTKLETQLAFFRENPDHVMLGGAVRIVDKKNNIERVKYSPKTHEEIIDKIFTFVPCQHSTVMFNTDRIPNDFTWYDPNQNIAEDLDLTFRLATYGKIANLDDILATIYERSESLSHMDVKNTFKQIYGIRKKAIKNYGFSPSWQSAITMRIQKFIVSVTPAQHIFPIYYAIRKHI